MVNPNKTCGYCGYSPKIALRLYALFDIIFGIVIILKWTEFINLRKIVPIYKTAGGKGVDSYLKTFVHINTEEEDVIHTLINARIKAGCNLRISADSIAIIMVQSFYTAVISVICMIIGFAGFILIAIVLACASFFCKNSLYCYTIINCLEVLFLVVTMGGVLAFQVQSLCPMNYNITYFEYFPRQRAVFVLGLLLSAYKLFELRAICQYIRTINYNKVIVMKKNRRSLKRASTFTQSEAPSFDTNSETVTESSKTLPESESTVDIESSTMSIASGSKSKPDVEEKRKSITARMLNRKSRQEVLMDYISKRTRADLEKSLPGYVPRKSEGSKKPRKSSVYSRKSSSVSRKSIQSSDSSIQSSITSRPSVPISSTSGQLSRRMSSVSRKSKTLPKKSDNVSRHSRSDNVSRHSKSDNVSRHSRSDNVSRHSKSDNVSRHSKSDNVSRHSKSSSISRHKQSGRTTAEFRKELNQMINKDKLTWLLDEEDMAQGQTPPDSDSVASLSAVPDGTEQPSGRPSEPRASLRKDKKAQSITGPKTKRKSSSKKKKKSMPKP